MCGYLEKADSYHCHQCYLQKLEKWVFGFAWTREWNRNSQQPARNETAHVGGKIDLRDKETNREVDPHGQQDSLTQRLAEKCRDRSSGT